MRNTGGPSLFGGGSAAGLSSSFLGSGNGDPSAPPFGASRMISIGTPAGSSRGASAPGFSSRGACSSSFGAGPSFSFLSSPAAGAQAPSQRVTWSSSHTPRGSSGIRPTSRYRLMRVVT
jgi:hypothetical protein